MTSLYVFAFTNQPAPPLLHGGRRIEFVQIEGVHAAIERLPARPAASEEELRAQHEIVMRIADSVDAILPARFGAWVEAAELERLVSFRRAPILDTLRLVSGRVQMTVRVYTPPGERPARMNAPAEAPRTGADYLAQRRRNSRVLTGDAAAISAAVRDLVRDERRHRGQGHLAWTLYHLVDRGAVGAYRQAAGALGSSLATVTGPWPPFAFVPDLWP